MMPLKRNLPRVLFLGYPLTRLFSTSSVSRESQSKDHRCNQCGQRFLKELDMKKHFLRRHSKHAGSSTETLEKKLMPAVNIAPPTELEKEDDIGKQEKSACNRKNSGDFECFLCLKSFKSMKDLEEHKETLYHRSVAMDLFNNDDLVRLECRSGDHSSLMKEVLELQRNCHALEREIEKLTVAENHLDEELEGKLPNTHQACCSMSQSGNIPLGYPFKFTYEHDSAIENQRNSSIEKASCEESPKTMASSGRKNFHSFVNDAHVIGAVNVEIMCAFRGSEPSTKFSILVRRPCLASRLQLEMKNANSVGRIIEEENFVVECRGEKWCNFVKESIRPGVIASISGRLSLRPQFHESDGSYTYNAVIEVTPADGSVEILLSEQLLG